MKANKISTLATTSLAVFALAAGSASATQTLIDLTFSPTNAGDVAAHPDISNITPWTNGSETLPDPFGGGAMYMPDNDFVNGYAGLTVPHGNFGYKWGFEGSFDVASANPWAVSEISFDYNVLGHNGEADLSLTVGSWSGNAPLPSTSGGTFGPLFDPVSNGEQASGTVTFNFFNRDSDSVEKWKPGLLGLLDSVYRHPEPWISHSRDRHARYKYCPRF